MRKNVLIVSCEFKWVGKATIPEIIRKHDSWRDKGFCLLASRMKNGVALLRTASLSEEYDNNIIGENVETAATVQHRDDR